jgi:hypothetical protein
MTVGLKKGELVIEGIQVVTGSSVAERSEMRRLGMLNGKMFRMTSGLKISMACKPG